MINQPSMSKPLPICSAMSAYELIPFLKQLYVSERLLLLTKLLHCNR